MERMEIEQKVREAVVKHLHVEESQVVPTAHFTKDLGADSLDTVELVMELEDVFNVEIPDAEAEKIQTVADAISYIEARL